MTRIACLLGAVVTLVSTASIAAPQHHNRPRMSNMPVTVRPAVTAYVPSYANRAPAVQTQSRAAVPSLSYIPPSSPNAPPFSFSPQDPLEGWHWQRVSLQQIDAEVRARRAAKSLANRE